MADRRGARGFRGQRRGTRRGSNWARLVNNDFQAVAAGTKVVLASLVLSNPGINETIVRTRGTFWVQSDQAAALEEQLGAFGMVVVSDLALAAGAASIPGPVTDANDDGWFVWEPFVTRNVSLTGAIPGQIYQFDSKAARRVQEGFGIAIIVENASATFGFEIAIGLSSLAVINT